MASAPPSPPFPPGFRLRPDRSGWLPILKYAPPSPPGFRLEHDMYGQPTWVYGGSEGAATPVDNMSSGSRTDVRDRLR